MKRLKGIKLIFGDTTIRASTVYNLAAATKVFTKALTSVASRLLQLSDRNLK